MDLENTSVAVAAVRRIKQAQSALEAAAQEREDAVVEARRQGVGWKAIGAALGMTTGVAHRHFHAIANAAGVGRRWRNNPHEVHIGAAD